MKLKASSTRTAEDGDRSTTHVALENPSQERGLLRPTEVTKGKGGEEVLPVVWQDNYISLLPGEKRDISASYRTADLGASAAQVEARGWNVEPAN